MSYLQEAVPDVGFPSDDEEINKASKSSSTSKSTSKASIESLNSALTGKKKKKNASTDPPASGSNMVASSPTPESPPPRPRHSADEDIISFDDTLKDKTYKPPEPPKSPKRKTVQSEDSDSDLENPPRKKKAKRLTKKRGTPRFSDRSTASELDKVHWDQD